MSWMMRIATVGVTVVALVALPLLLNVCAVSCEAEHEAAASTPACHHAGATPALVGQESVPCGHDHHGTVVTAADIAAAPQLRVFTWDVADVTVPAQRTAAADSQFVLIHAPPGSSPALSARSLPLRV